MKIIQVGIGGMGNAWLNAVQNSDTVEFAGFVEVSDDIAAQQVEAYNLDGSTVYRTLEEALDKLDADAVLNVTPPQFHKPISFTALEAGLPVLSEKPLAGTLEDSRDIVAKANETGVLHMITQNYRYTVPAQTLKRELDSGDYGAVGSVSVQFYKGPHFGGFREEMPYPLIIDMSIHHFDMMRFLLDADPVTVFGRSWNPSWSWYDGDASAAVVADFSNGVHVDYDGSWCSQGRETTWNANWRFECEKGVVTLQDDIVYVQHLTGVEDRPGYRHVANDEVAVADPVDMPREAQAYLLHEFYEAVTNGTTPATTAQDNIKTIEFVFGVVESFKTNTVVELSR